MAHNLSVNGLNVRLRFVLLLGVVVLSVAGTVRLIGQDNCETCKPPLGNAVISGHYNICVDHNLSSVVADGMLSGARYWTDYLNSTGVVASANVLHEPIQGNSNCDIKVFTQDVNSDMEALATPNGYGSEIRIDPSVSTRPEREFWDEMLGHEFGHIVGFANVNHRPGCLPYTLMVSGTPLLGYLPSGPLCGDVNSIAAKYGSGPHEGGGTSEEPAEGEDNEQCYAYYYVTYRYYIFPNGDVVQETTGVYYLYTQCYPLEDGD